MSVLLQCCPEVKCGYHVANIVRLTVNLLHGMLNQCSTVTCPVCLRSAFPNLCQMTANLTISNPIKLRKENKLTDLKQPSPVIIRR